jgi:formylglycine-generating enzyme required for sulfatase activity
MNEELNELIAMLNDLEKLQQSGGGNGLTKDMMGRVIGQVKNMINRRSAGAGDNTPGPVLIKTSVRDMFDSRGNVEPGPATRGGAADNTGPSIGKASSRDMIDIGGNTGPGSTTGGGITHNEGPVVGGDLINAETLVTTTGPVTINMPPNAVKDKPDQAASGMSDLERTYLLWLREVSSRVPLGKMDWDVSTPGHSALDIRLNEIYVPLDTLHTPAPPGGNPVEWTPVPLLHDVIRIRQIVILGDPGSGKSTFLNYLTLCLVGARLHPDRGYLDSLKVPKEGQRRAANWTHGALLPVRVDLREFANGIPKKAKAASSLVVEHIRRQLQAHNLSDFAKEVEKALHAGKCMVMFDGLDEIVDKGQRKVVRDSLTDFARNFAHCRMIVTCRVLSYTDPDWRLAGFPSVTLDSLSQSSIDLFISRWYNALVRLGSISQDTANQRAKRLRDATANLRDLAGNPMLLTVMCVIHTYSKGTLPRERAHLYDECIKLLLWDWQRAKEAGLGDWQPGIVDVLETREERLINALCEVAFRAQGAQNGSSGTVHIPESEVMGVLKRYLDDWDKAEKFCDYVETRAGLLIGRGQTSDSAPVFSFPHRGFQEFLAARHVVTHRDFERSVVALAEKGDVWHEVLLLAIGHLVYNQADVYRPLNAINLLCRPEMPTSEAGWRSVWWAAEMLTIVGRSVAEQDDLVGRDLVKRLMAQLVQLVEGGHLTPVERAQAGDTLGYLGDPRPGVCTLEPVMIRIEGGDFDMGSDGERHRVKVRPFYIAKYPVTNAQFRQFVEKDGPQQDKYWTKAGLEWRNRAGNRNGHIDDPQWGIDNRPVVGITWYEAVAFASWLREVTRKPYRLLTEAEWELVCAGKEGRKYPFGNRASVDSLNSHEAGVKQTTAAGIFPHDKTPENIYDMGGNVWEWCSSLTISYPYRANDGREDLSRQGPRTLRGGGYSNAHAQIHASQRKAVDPQVRVPMIGFRLGMDAP